MRHEKYSERCEVSHIHTPGQVLELSGKWRYLMDLVVLSAVMLAMFTLGWVAGVEWTLDLIAR